jgi:hypothetical protein
MFPGRYPLLSHETCASQRVRKPLKDIPLAMFTVYIDDSGTDPNQLVAIASGLILPAIKLAALEKEWETFKDKESITDFRTSECVCCNPKSDFASWDQVRVKNISARVRQIIRKYSIKGFAIAINKEVHDGVIPSDMRKTVGEYHYTFAVDALCGWINDWAATRSVPMEYVFDYLDKSQKPQKKEIER